MCVCHRLSVRVARSERAETPAQKISLAETMLPLDFDLDFGEIQLATDEISPVRRDTGPPSKAGFVFSEVCPLVVDSTANQRAEAES